MCILKSDSKWYMLMYSTHSYLFVAYSGSPKSGVFAVANLKGGVSKTLYGLPGVR